MTLSKAGSEKRITRHDLIKQHERILSSLQYDTGLFAASRKDVATGYDKSWLRDNFYECLAFEMIGEWEVVRKTYRALLKVFKKHEAKIDAAIENRPQHKHEYIHARIHPETFEEFWEDWGNKQNDAIGAILFRIGELEHAGFTVLKDDDDQRVVQKLIWYLNSIEYWHDWDSGIWEENEEVHASSLGACVAGLKSLKQLNRFDIPVDLIEKGEDALHEILPRESASKFVDLALLSLVWPYMVVTPEERDQILENVEYHLLKENGVIRYKNDHYYNKNADGYSEEAEWCFGLSWLAIIHTRMGNAKKAQFFVKEMLESVDDDGFVPELYFSNSDEPNENRPLGWAESLFIVALHNVTDKEFKKALENLTQKDLDDLTAQE
jgi:GH15 family glucan-1,4-alpha-glucosidase